MNRNKKFLEHIDYLRENGELLKIKNINEQFKTDYHVTGEKYEDCLTTLLGLAAYEADKSLVETLIKSGADVNIPMRGYRQDYSPLHMAIYGAYRREDGDKNLDDRIYIINILHDHGADMDWNHGNPYDYAWTPLATAAYHNLPTLGSELLKLGANPIAPSSAYGITDIKYLNSNSAFSAFMELACQAGVLHEINKLTITHYSALFWHI